MASKRKARLSDDGARILNKMSKESDNPPLLSKRKITQACKQLERVINYKVYGNFSFRMQNVHSFLEERMRRANIEDKNLVWYLDKGRGRVVSTVGLVGSSTTQSHYNQTILPTWEGSDHYDALAYHDVGKFYKELSMDNYKITCGMAYPCTWCSKKFIKRSNSEESIDLEVYESRSDKRVEEAIARDKKLKKRKEKIVDIPEEMIVPPILHILKQCQLDVDRHVEKIIYIRFHGNDIKRMCTSIDALSKVSTSEGYQQVIKAMDVFNEWSKIVSSTKKNLSDKELMVLYCRNSEHLGEQCCQTIKLARCLDVVGGASKRALVHIVLMHLGPFEWDHKMIGALAEEDIEAVHCRFAEEMKRHVVPPKACKHGEVYIKLFWCDLRPPATIPNDIEWLTANKTVHTLLLMAFVDNVRELPYPKANLEPSPILDFTIGNKTQRTPVKVKTVNPVYQFKCYFFVQNSEVKELTIKAIDSTTSKLLGELSISLGYLMEQLDMEVFDKVFQLRQDVRAIHVTLTLRARIDKTKCF
ncbi:unnamed protein product [Bursaphelenchus okinawaensis]|uniref:C2 domain-containing protein n=1 Tax=Bursaphelenchus okinawaensis TaxID=465554 RepID=A0A811KBQ9_9BILA|nr:unnamed protein product [Bursaphelenchus okinawaensis]CAG9101133.1 unnamed protein product [Bursaphelenchus okinawaensis]